MLMKLMNYNQISILFILIISLYIYIFIKLIYELFSLSYIWEMEKNYKKAIEFTKLAKDILIQCL